MDKRITNIVGNKIYYIHAPQSADLYVEYMFYNKMFITVRVPRAR